MPSRFATIVTSPLTVLWKLSSGLSLLALRGIGLLSPPARLPPDDTDMSGRVVIVTGANTGIGERTAFHLARMGAKVIMACRSLERGKEARAKMEKEIRELVATTPGNGKAVSSGRGQGTSFARDGTLEVMQCDLGDLESVRAFARAFEAMHGRRLDVLVNNAGIATPPPGSRLTADGLDMTFGVNFVGHFALTLELMPLLQTTAGARVVCLSSMTHHLGCTEWESAMGGHVGHWGRSTYADSKLAMVLFAKELRRRFAAAGCSATAFSVNPGAVRSDIWRFVPKLLMPICDIVMRVLFLEVEEGCCTSVCTSALPLKSLSGGDYYQPYWMPFNYPVPFEVMGPFIGCAAAQPTVPVDEAAVSAKMWAVCERAVKVARAARGNGTASVARD